MWCFIVWDAESQHVSKTDKLAATVEAFDRANIRVLKAEPRASTGAKEAAAALLREVKIWSNP